MRNGNLLGGFGTSFENLSDQDTIAFDANAQAWVNTPLVAGPQGEVGPQGPQGDPGPAFNYVFPTTDPMVVGAFWNDNGTLTLSAATEE